jgi:hypothetical protein
MSGGTSGLPERGANEAEETSRQPAISPRGLTIAAIAACIVLAAIVVSVYYRSSRSRREQEAQLRGTLDKLVTAQEGFYYDSTRYVSSLRSLRALQVPPNIRLQITSPAAQSWWGIASHAALPGRHCVVWVGNPPAWLPDEARVPENETKPLCFDGAPPIR